MLLVIPILQREGWAQTDLQLTKLWLQLQHLIFQAEKFTSFEKDLFYFLHSSAAQVSQKGSDVLPLVFWDFFIVILIFPCHLLSTWISLVFTYGQSSGSWETADEMRPPWFPFPREDRVSRWLTLQGSPLTSVWACPSRSGFCCTLC